MIGILCANLDANGGLEIVTKRLYNAFKEKNIDVKLYSCKKSVWNDAISFNVENKLTQYFIKQIVDQIRRDSVNILIVQVNDPFRCVLANISLYRDLHTAGVKIFTVLHNSPKSFLVHYSPKADSSFLLFLKNLKAKVLLAPKAKYIIRCLSKFSSFISISKGTKYELEFFYNVDSIVIPNFFDFSISSSSQCISEKKHSLAMICRIDYYQKNFMLLLDAWHKVPDKKNWMLNIIGCGDKTLINNYIQAHISIGY